MVAAAQKEHAPLVKRAPTSPRFVDLTGRKFGKLTVREFLGFKGKLPVFLCECSCGGTIDAWANLLNCGRVQHCGCDKVNDGHSRHPLFHTWAAMIQRCENKKDPGYKNYGARGIAVCRRWRESFNDFLADVGERPSRGHSLGRIDNDGNYEPGNVRWETAVEQARNKRTCHFITLNGETKTSSEWADALGITREAMRLRLKKAATIEAILTTPKGDVVVSHPKNMPRDLLADDAPPRWPQEITLGVTHHALAESSAAALEAIEALRKFAAAWGYGFRSRALDEHILFRFSIH